jgi:hypothetical protein
MILGLPWYDWAFLGFGVILMFVIALFIYYWYKMGPCQEYFTAARNGYDLGFLCMKGGKAKLKALKYIAGMFNGVGLPLSWIQRSPDSFRFGEVNAKVIMDQWGITVNTQIQEAVKTAIEEWNNDHIDEAGNPYQQITCYRDLIELIRAGQIDDPILTPAVCEVPLFEIINYLQQIRAADLEAHVSERVSEEVEDRTGQGWPMWMKIFIGCQLGIIMLCVGLYMILSKVGG